MALAHMPYLRRKANSRLFSGRRYLAVLNVLKVHLISSGEFRNDLTIAIEEL